MKIFNYTYILIIAFIFCLQASDNNSYPQYRQVKINFENKSQVQDLAKSGLIFDHVAVEIGKGDAFSYTAVLNGSEFDVLQNSGLRFSVEKEDLIADYKNREKFSIAQVESWDDHDPLKGFELGSMGGFYTLDEVLAELDSMFVLYPELITAKDSIGTTHEGRTIWMVKISDNPDQDENEPEVLFTALHHAREPGSMMTVVYFMYYLLENYGTDEEVTYLVNNRELFFVPVVNPDGFEYNHQMSPDGGYMWRKNKRDNNNNGIFSENDDGVDLNRNYGYGWGYDNNGSSPLAGSDVYRGPEPFSEPETQAIRNFCNQRQFKIAMNYHTYSNLLIYPWGFIASYETPDSSVFRRLASDMTQYNQYTWGTGDVTVGYLTNGGSDDWMYGEQSSKNKIFSMTPEVGSGADGFWPDASRIYPHAQENLYPNLYAARAAGGFIGRDSFYISLGGDEDEYLEAGEMASIRFDLKNIGLGTIKKDEFSWQIIWDDPYVQPGDADLSVLPDSLISGESFTTSNYEFEIDSLVPTGHIVSLKLQIVQNGLTTIEPLQEIIIGEPSVYFSDNFETANSIWAPESPWGRSSVAAANGRFSFTDSPTGDYDNYLNKSLYLDSLLDLSSYNTAFVEFNSRWDIEAGWDFAEFQISNDGAQWQNLAGKYTKNGTGAGRQTLNQPGYDGTQSTWVKEQVNISEFIAEPFFLRFRLRSDEYVTGDGWYIDDFRILVYSDSVLTHLAGDNKQALRFSLRQNYPNPFNPETRISFEMSEPANVNIKIYDAIGREIKTLYDGFKQAGSYQLTWDGTNDKGLSVASGIYFYRMQTKDFQSMKKLVLVH
ncbi:MAG: immune inhibitor A [Calditrichae bacterium]|nr:immune inhibitor A [Calditrichota bacterium]MCB9057484.1 immune inhibitor A [Calditrichia bacterium]